MATKSVICAGPDSCSAVVLASWARPKRATGKLPRPINAAAHKKTIRGLALRTLCGTSHGRPRPHRVAARPGAPAQIGRIGGQLELTWQARAWRHLAQVDESTEG